MRTNKTQSLGLNNCDVDGVSVDPRLGRLGIILVNGVHDLALHHHIYPALPKTTWCREHGISDKSFFYWQRILREEAYLTTLESTLTPAVKENPTPTTTDFIEIKMTDHASSSTSPFKPDVVIRRGAVSIEISNTATEELLNKVGGLLHA